MMTESDQMKERLKADRLRELLEFLKQIPHSGQVLKASTLSFASLLSLKGPMLRQSVNDTPLHKKGFDAECFRCQMDQLIEKVVKE